MKTLVRIPVPARLADEMMLKHAASFAVPDTDEGVAFAQAWEKLGHAERDRLMRHAYENGITLLEAFARDSLSE